MAALLEGSRLLRFKATCSINTPSASSALLHAADKRHLLNSVRKRQLNVGSLLQHHGLPQVQHHGELPVLHGAAL